MADAGIADLDGPARLVISLVEDGDDDPGTAPLGEWLAENTTRLRPPRSFSLGYDTEAIDSNGTYLLQARLEDVETGALLATGSEAIADLGDAESITVRIAAPAE